MAGGLAGLMLVGLVGGSDVVVDQGLDVADFLPGSLDLSALFVSRGLSCQWLEVCWVPADTCSTSQHPEPNTFDHALSYPLCDVNIIRT